MFIGLVGKPSAGKSTFFKAATLMNVETANYPFTTIRPNSGVSFVMIECVDRDFRKQCNIAHHGINPVYNYQTAAFRRQFEEFFLQIIYIIMFVWIIYRLICLNLVVKNPAYLPIKP